MKMKNTFFFLLFAKLRSLTPALSQKREGALRLAALGALLAARSDCLYFDQTAVVIPRVVNDDANLRSGNARKHELAPGFVIAGDVAAGNRHPLLTVPVLH